MGKILTNCLIMTGMQFKLLVPNLTEEDREVMNRTNHIRTKHELGEISEREYAVIKLNKENKSLYGLWANQQSSKCPDHKLESWYDSEEKVHCRRCKNCNERLF